MLKSLDLERSREEDTRCFSEGSYSLSDAAGVGKMKDTLQIPPAYTILRMFP